MSGSLSSLVKGLQAALSSQSTRNSAELSNLVQLYIDKHTPPSENDRAKLQEELRQIHRAYVTEVNSAAFLHILTALKHDFIIDPEACATWWSLLLAPILNLTEILKDTLRDSLTICIDALVFREDDSDFKTRHAAADRLKACIIESYFTAVTSEKRKVAENLEHLLFVYAKKRTQDFFESIDPFMQNPQYRLHSLTLLSTFVRLQTQYIYKIANTTLLNSLLLCLEHDASTTVVSLALTVLIMIVPQIPDRLSTMLPRLFGVFGRVLCWDTLSAVRKRTAALVNVEHSDERSTSADIGQAIVEEKEGEWKRLDASFDIAYSTPPKCAQYFTFLYGLYPINFVTYIRAASEYNQTGAIEPSTFANDNFDDEMIRSRAEPFVRRHLVHPNFTALTLDSELSDSSRWMKLEPSDVVTLCISLDTFNIDVTTRARHEAPLDDDVEALTLESNVQHPPMDSATEVASDRARSPEPRAYNRISEKYNGAPLSMMDSFMSESSDPASGSRLASPAFLPRLILTDYKQASNLSRNSSMSKASLMSPTDALRIHQELQFAGIGLQTNREGLLSPPTTIADDSKAATSFYQRELLLLKNELNFERHLKQQHIQHIGRLQRDIILDAALESERQNLYNTTRALKSQVNNLKEILKNLRNETSTSKANRATYEAGLNERIKRLREEKSVLQNNEQALNDALELAKDDVSNMRMSLGVAEGMALNLRQQLQVLQPEIQQAKDLQKNFDLLKTRIKEAEIQDIQLTMEKERVEAARAQVKTMELALEALRRDYDQTVKDYHGREIERTGNVVPALARQSNITENTSSENIYVRQSAERLADLERLQARHTELVGKYASLQSTLLDCRAEIESKQLSIDHNSNSRPQMQSRAYTSSSSPPSQSRTPFASVPGRTSTAENVGTAAEEKEPKGLQNPEIVHGARRTDNVNNTTDRWSPATTSTSIPVNPASKSAQNGKTISADQAAKAKKVSREKAAVLGGRFHW